jgi:4-carboxymuconolactone decarboxylase
MQASSLFMPQHIRRALPSAQLRTPLYMHTPPGRKFLKWGRRLSRRSLSPCGPLAGNTEEHHMTDQVRIAPIAPENFTAEQASLVGEWRHLTFSRVLVNSPRMYRTFVPHLEELVSRTVLSARDRQIVCLRILALSNETYEKVHHITISRKIGMTDADIFAVLELEEGKGVSLTDADRIVIEATDELFRDQRIGDATWSKLAESYSPDQLMEIVFLAGCYVTMGMLTKSFGIQLEPDFESFNALRDYA